MLCQAGTEHGLNRKQGHGTEVRAKDLGVRPVASGEPPESQSLGDGRAGVISQSRRDFSKLAYLSSKVNTNLRSLSREGAVQ